MSVLTTRALKVLMIVLSVCEACRSSAKRKGTTTIQPTTENTTTTTEITTTSTTEKVASNLLLPVPNPKYITINEGGVVVIAWDPVEVKEDNPILGIKIKLWDQERNKVHKYTTVNGTSQLTEEWVPVEKSLHELPRQKPALEAVLPPDAIDITIMVNEGEKYEIRGQSYNAEGDGPLSSATLFKINTKENN